MVFSLAACGGGDSGDTQEPADDGGEATPAPVSGEEGSIPGVKKDLIIGISSDITSLNLPMQNTQINNNCIKLTHQSLTTLDNQVGEVHGCLAESWEWTDEHHLVFHLRKDVYFSDGTPMTAHDVVFTYETCASTDPTVSAVSGTFKGLTEFKALDDYTFEITCESYNNELVNGFGPPAMIRSKAAYEDPNNAEPWLIGTGQYIFAERVEGQYVKFVRNENYWGKDLDDAAKGDAVALDPGMADEIIFKVLPEASQRVIALQNGEIDVCVDPPESELQFLEEDPNITVENRDGRRLNYLGFNVQKAPFDNKTLRQAVSCAIDKDSIISIVLGGKGKPQTTVLNRGVWSFLEDDEVEGGYTYDVERAKELLAQAGYQPGELSVTLYTPNSAPYSTIAPIVQANLDEIGIAVEIVTMDTATIQTECAAGKQDMYLLRWNSGDSLQEVYHGLFASDSASNYSHLNDPYVDETGHQVLTLRDQEERKQASWDLQNYLVEEVPQVPLFVADLTIAYNKNLDGTCFYGGGNHTWSWTHVKLG